MTTPGSAKKAMIRQQLTVSQEKPFHAKKNQNRDYFIERSKAISYTAISLI